MAGGVWQAMFASFTVGAACLFILVYVCCLNLGWIGCGCMAHFVSYYS